MFTLNREGGKEIQVCKKPVVVFYGGEMTAKMETQVVQENEERVTVHAQKGATVAITLTENHYHYPEWLTPEMLIELAIIMQRKREEG